MKNFKLFRFKPQFLVIAVAFLSVFTMCSKKEKEPDTLVADLSKVTFLADDTAEKSITVTSNTTWTSSRSDSWIETRQSENKLYIKVDNYSNTDNSRTGTITLSGGDALPVTITIEQAKKEINTLTVTPSVLDYKANESGTKTVSVTTNSKDGWNATTDKSWITLTKKDNTIEVKVGAYTGSSERTGSIKVTAGNAPEKTITVNQAAEITLSVSPKSLDFGNGEGVKDITVTTNADEWTSSKTASWITLTKVNNKLSVEVSENTSTSERSSNVKITAGDKEVTIPVKQAGKTPDIYISTNVQSISFTGNSPADQNIQVTTNASTWTATTPVSWLTLTKSGQTLRVKATTNGNTARSATITFNADNGKATSTVSVLQAGQPIPLPPEFATYTGSGSPKLLQNSGPSTWTGIWLNVSGLRYSLTGWGGRSITSFMNYNTTNRNFIIEHNTSVVTDNSNSNIKGYFVAFVISGNKLTVIKDYPIPYNSSTKVIDFSGKVSGSDVCVGIIAVEGAFGDTFTLAGGFADGYANAKLVLTDYLDAPRIDNNAATRSMKFSGEKIKIDLNSIKKVEVKSINDF